MLVLTTGTFDLLHPGHVSLFREIKERYSGCVLMVGINGDRRVDEIKQKHLFSASDRASVVGSLADVDVVTVFEEDTPLELIGRVCPDVFVKGPDWIGRELPEAGMCEKIGCEVVFMGTKTHNSSELKRLLDAG